MKMKKVFICMLALAMVLLLVPVAFAASPYVTDLADTMTAAELAQLEQRAADVSKRLNTSFAAVIIDNLMDADIEAYADQYYKENSYLDNGVLLVVALDVGTVYSCSFGDAAQTYTSSVLEDTIADVIDALNEDRFYDGLAAYYNHMDITLGAAQTGEAFMPDLPRVVDEADLLTDAEEEALQTAALTVAEEYDSDVVIVTTNNVGSKSAMEYADDYFDYNGYGYGEKRDGVLLLVAMDKRTVWISTRGRAILAFTDYGIERALDVVQPYLSDGEYEKSMSAFVETAQTYYQAAFVDGKPIDVHNEYVPDPPSYFERMLKILPISLVVGLAISLIRLSILCGRHKTAKPQRAASVYVRPGSLNLRVSTDQYLHTTTSRTRIEQSSSGGSSSHSSSSGASHGGGGRGF